MVGFGGRDKIKNFHAKFPKKGHPALNAFLREIREIQWSPPIVWDCYLSAAVVRHLLSNPPESKWWQLWKACDPKPPPASKPPVLALLDVKIAESRYKDAEQGENV